MSKNIFLLAGEPSGDTLGASLMRAIKSIEPDVSFEGVGGDHMKAQGMVTLLPMKELSVMGIWEILWQLPRLIKLVNGIVDEIEERKPDVVITLDFPDFNFQVARVLRKRGNFKGKLIHYVAPSVWAWRPKRAEYISNMYDGLMCLFPFEPKYFEPFNLKTVCVGHPLVEEDFDAASGVRFREMYKMAPDAKVLGLFLGSRHSELKRMASVIVDSARVLKEDNPDLEIILPTLPSLEFDVLNAVRGCGFELTVCTNEDHKWDSFKACDLAIAVSGTVALELAYMGVPHVITYKTHPVTWEIIKRMIKINHAHLANILLDKEVVPEFLQLQSNPIKISKKLLQMTRNPQEGEEQKAEFRKLRELLGADDEKSPSQKAAQFVLEG